MYQTFRDAQLTRYPAWKSPSCDKLAVCAGINLEMVVDDC